MSLSPVIPGQGATTPSRAYPARLFSFRPACFTNHQRRPAGAGVILRAPVGHGSIIMDWYEFVPILVMLAILLLFMRLM